jgi:NADPH2:quinone reductase
MKAIQVTEFGGPEVLRLAEVADPVVAPGEVLISVRVAGVPFGDTIVRSGAYPVPLPYIPGLEVAGTVVRVGTEVDHALLDANVVATTRDSRGGYAELAVANARDVTPVPSGVAEDLAVAVFQAGAVATALVDVMAVEAGETALVLAAAGRIGTMLVQLLARRGVRVIAAVGTSTKQSVVLSLGAHHAVVYDSSDWVEAVRTLGPATIVFDGVGGAIGAQSIATLADGRGRLAVHGYASGSWTSPDPQMLARRGLTVTGAIGRAVRLPLQQRRSNIRAILEDVASGTIHAVSPTSYHLGDAASAHAAVENRAISGAALLVVGDW